MPKLDAVDETNPEYRQTVGGAIFGFVRPLVKFAAPRVTGLMIDLPVPDIKKYMQNYNVFVDRV